MIQIINTIFGTYTQQIDPVSGAAVVGVAGVDWPWLAGVLLFAICLFSLFRIIGVVMKK